MSAATLQRVTVLKGYIWYIPSGPTQADPHACCAIDIRPVLLQAPFQWRQVSPPFAHAAALAAYQKNHSPAAPCGRYNIGASMHNGSLLISGGHDGGYSCHGQEGYEAGYAFDELWSISLNNLPTATTPAGLLQNVWALVRQAAGSITRGGSSSSSSSLSGLVSSAWQLLHTTGRSCRLDHQQTGISEVTSPGGRYLYRTVVVSNVLYVYSGMSQGQGDVWAYSLGNNSWHLVSAEVQLPNGPGRRIAHAMLPVSGYLTNHAADSAEGFLVVGGRDADSVEYRLHNDVWFFDVRQGSWRPLPVEHDDGLKHSRRNITAAHAIPAARLYHAATVLDKSSVSVVQPQLHRRLPHWQGQFHVYVIMGGSTSIPAITCAADSWMLVMDIAANKVKWLQLPDHAFPVYEHQITVQGGIVYSFGGHLCHGPGRDTAKFPFDYTNAVTQLHLGQSLQHAEL